MSGDTKLIRIKKRTWERLRSHGRMGETFDQVVNRVLNGAEDGKRE